MPEFQYLLVETTDKITTITLNRPHALNALNKEMMSEIDSCLQSLIGKHETGGIIITGSGDKAFAAGADIKEFISLSGPEALALAKSGQALYSRIEHLGIPVIAAVNGFALGGGCELAMACHMRFAVKTAKLGQPEVNLGIIPGYGGTQRLAQLAGRAKAMELILTGDLISADKAQEIGLVNQVFESHVELMDNSRSILSKILTKAPLAITAAIRSINSGFSFEDAGYSSEAENFALCSQSEDFKEGTAAFIEKRKPAFKGK